MFINRKKKVKVFVRLLEGAEVLVPCTALHIQNDVYEIVRNDSFDMEDKTSIWEFFPGDLVKCKRSKEILVATKLISSTFADRSIYELIFKIVKTVGEITIDQLTDYESEIKQLCQRSDILQREHPLVWTWLKKTERGEMPCGE